MNRILLVTTMFVVAACATSNPEPDQSESFGAAVSGGDKSLQHNNSAENIDGTETVAENFEGIEAIEAPGVSETPMPPPRMVEPEVVCERMVPTGSTLPIKVCRLQSDIDRNHETDLRLMDDIKRSTMNGASRL
jgi:hypothetical protein